MSAIPIPPGRYRARCTGARDVTWGLSRNGDLQIGLCFEILAGDLKGETISWVGTFSDRGGEHAVRALEACGWTGEDPTADLSGLGSEPVVLTIEHDEGSDGRVYTRVKWVNRPGTKVRFGTPVEGQALRSHGATIRAAVRALRAAAGHVSAPPPRQQRTRREHEPTDGELDF